MFIFPLLVSGYFRSAHLRVVSIVSGGCNQSSSGLWYVVSESLYWCINAVFNACKSSSPSFLDTYSLSTSSLGFKALKMVISFLMFWSICLSSFLFPLKNGPNYLPRGTARTFIPLPRFLRQSFVLCSFLVFLGYLLIFSFISICLMVSTSNIPLYL